MLFFKIILIFCICAVCQSTPLIIYSHEFFYYLKKISFLSRAFYFRCKNTKYFVFAASYIKQEQSSLNSNFV